MADASISPDTSPGGAQDRPRGREATPEEPISSVDGRRPRGRPRGATAQGVETRRRLYETAIRLVAARGWHGTTLRDVAAEAGVSVGLLYRYFPSKQAVLLALYDELSAEYAARAAELASGRWRDRFLVALRTSLDVLRPHRSTLAALVGVLVSPSEDGLFASGTAFSRLRVQAVFVQAVAGATDAPRGEVGLALGRLLYLLHLAVLLWWLLDKSPSQRATDGLVALFGRTLPLIAIAIRVPTVPGLLLAADRLVREALLGDSPSTPRSPRDEQS
ncbi:MAG: TetR/AcrR family transcriptional regulator [Chloroflexota bacterium]